MDKEIQEIHENIINGNRTDAAKLIDEYGKDFFSEYKSFLIDLYDDTDSSTSHAAFNCFSDAVLSYFRIKKR
jgi:hypothetical protein